MVTGQSTGLVSARELLQATPLQGVSTNAVAVAFVFVVLALVVAAAGAREVAGLTMETARWFVLLFIAFAALTFVL